MIPAPNRRWFRFSLRTMFVVVTLVGCWLGNSLIWIKQRHELLDKSRGSSKGKVSAPGHYGH